MTKTIVLSGREDNFSSIRFRGKILNPPSSRKLYKPTLSVHLWVYRKKNFGKPSHEPFQRMPDEVVPYRGAGPVATLPAFVAANWLARHFSPREIYNTGRDIVQNTPNVRQYLPKFDRRQTTTSGSRHKRGMPGFKRGYGRRRVYRRRRVRRSRRARGGKQKRTQQRRRVAARKYGSLRAARKVTVTIGGLTKRKLIRLKDNYNFMTPTSMTAGKNMTYHYCLNDLANPTMSGRIIVNPATATKPVTYDFADSRAIRTNSHNTTDMPMRPVPMSLSQKDFYNKQTVIGSSFTITINNKEGAGSGNHEHPIWYAYRVDPYISGQGNFPRPIDDDITYSQLKETGRWRMGIIKSSISDNITKTLHIKYSSVGFWGKEVGKPGIAKNVPTGTATENGFTDGVDAYIEAPCQDNGSTTAITENVYEEGTREVYSKPDGTGQLSRLALRTGNVKYKAVLRLILGPWTRDIGCNGGLETDWQDLPTGTTDQGSDQTRNLAITQTLCSVTANYMVSCHEQKKALLMDDLGIIYPKWNGTTIT